MNQVYEPLKDPAADGYTFVGAAVDLTAENELSKPDWKEPLWAKFKAFCWGFSKAALIVVLVLAGVVLYQSYKNHAKTVEVIQNPPSGSPEIGASPKNKGLGYGKSHTSNKADKSATENIATDAINTPSATIIEAVKPSAKKPVSKESLPTEFDKQLAEFETRIKKEFP